MLKGLTSFFNRIVQRYLPDAFFIRYYFNVYCVLAWDPVHEQWAISNGGALGNWFLGPLSLCHADVAHCCDGVYSRKQPAC